jgi:hypothetical protein
VFAKKTSPDKKEKSEATYRTPFPKYKVDFNTASSGPKGDVFFDGPNPPLATKATLLKGKGVYTSTDILNLQGTFFLQTPVANIRGPGVP